MRQQWRDMERLVRCGSRAFGSDNMIWHVTICRTTSLFYYRIPQAIYLDLCDDPCRCGQTPLGGWTLFILPEYHLPYVGLVWRPSPLWPNASRRMNHIHYYPNTTAICWTCVTTLAVVAKRLQEDELRSYYPNTTAICWTCVTTLAVVALCLF